MKQKVNALLDRYEDPREALDYSYTKQLEMLNNLRRSIVEVVTSKKRLEMQKLKLFDGAEFDAKDPEKYARSFAVHSMA